MAVRRGNRSPRTPQYESQPCSPSFGIGVTAARKVLVLVVGVRIPRPEPVHGGREARQLTVNQEIGGSTPPRAALG